MGKKSKYENVDFGDLPSNYLVNLGKEEFVKKNLVHENNNIANSKIDKIKVNIWKKGD
ncbi:MAG: hypothetical protein K0R54_2790 [Clostridiaceae bacterium]|jgi:uncharacterized protein YcgL (UPF0745 family)|nr:hypothetical protein [Clostridiaceae bacterium]